MPTQREIDDLQNKLNALKYKQEKVREAIPRYESNFVNTCYISVTKTKEKLLKSFSAWKYLPLKKDKFTEKDPTNLTYSTRNISFGSKYRVDDFQCKISTETHYFGSEDNGFYNREPQFYRPYYTTEYTVGISITLEFFSYLEKMMEQHIQNGLEFFNSLVDIEQVYNDNKESRRVNLLNPKLEVELDLNHKILKSPEILITPNCAFKQLVNNKIVWIITPNSLKVLKKHLEYRTSLDERLQILHLKKYSKRYGSSMDIIEKLLHWTNKELIKYQKDT